MCSTGSWPGFAGWQSAHLPPLRVLLPGTNVRGVAVSGGEIRYEHETAAFAWGAGWWLAILIGGGRQPVPATCCENILRALARRGHHMHASIEGRQRPSCRAGHPSHSARMPYRVVAACSSSFSTQQFATCGLSTMIPSSLVTSRFVNPAAPCA